MKLGGCGIKAEMCKMIPEVGLEPIRLWRTGGLTAALAHPSLFLS